MQKDTLSFSFKLYRSDDDYLSAPFTLFIYVLLTNGVIQSHLSGVYGDLIKINIPVVNQEYTDVQTVFKERLWEIEIPNFKDLYFIYSSG